MQNSRYKTAMCMALTGPDAIEIQDAASRAPGDDELCIAIKAAGLTFPDLLMTQGKYQYRPDPPFVPGTEFAGEIIAAGKNISDFQIGDRIMGSCKGGAFAEQITLPSHMVNPLPDALSFEEGACWHSAAITAWHALHDRANLQAGEDILILGASGGVGMASVQLAKHMGARVIASASSEEKRAIAENAGADVLLDPSDPDFAKKVKAATGGNGANVVFDPVGGDLAITATRAIAINGRYLIVGFASGNIPSFPANHALIKEYSLIGLRAGESGRRDPQLGDRNKIQLSKFAKEGIMRPHISHRIPFSQISTALQLLESRSVIGRAVIQMEI